MVMLDVEPTPVVTHDGIWYVGLTEQDYENLSKNLSALLAHIKQKNAVIVYYRECLRVFNDSNSK